MAGTVKIRVKIPRKLLTQRGALRKKIRKFMLDTMDVASELVRSEIAKDAPLGALGILGNSFVSVRAKDRGGRIAGGVRGISYSKQVNEGHGGKGKFPPHDPIELWLRRTKGLTGRELRSATFLTRRKIAKIGVKANRFIDKAVKKTRRQVEGLFRSAFKRLGQ